MKFVKIGEENKVEEIINLNYIIRATKYPGGKIEIYTPLGKIDFGKSIDSTRLWDALNAEVIDFKNQNTSQNDS